MLVKRCFRVLLIVLADTSVETQNEYQKISQVPNVQNSNAAEVFQSFKK